MGGAYTPVWLPDNWVAFPRDGDAAANQVTPTNSASFTPWSAAIISAAFSPIMIDAAFVFPLTTLGMTLASATRSFSYTQPRASRGSTTLPMRQVHRQVVHGYRKMQRKILE